LTIRSETLEDGPAIAEVTARAFGKEREARMVEAIRRSDGYVPELSFVAELEGRIVGHMMLSYVGLRRRREAGAGARPDERHAGEAAPGRRFRSDPRGAAPCRGARRAAVLVLGHATYYPRFGFRPARKLGITLPDPSVGDEFFMALALRAYDPTLRGRVVFPPAFTDED
jgi:putative acetyltransferase